MKQRVLLVESIDKKETMNHKKRSLGGKRSLEKFAREKIAWEEGSTKVEEGLHKSGSLHTGAPQKWVLTHRGST